jgi:type IV secretory pathway TrbF-like protein
LLNFYYVQIYNQASAKIKKYKRKNQPWLRIKNIKIKMHKISKNSRLWSRLMIIKRVGIA